MGADLDYAQLFHQRFQFGKNIWRAWFLRNRPCAIRRNPRCFAVFAFHIRNPAGFNGATVPSAICGLYLFVSHFGSTDVDWKN